MPSRKYRIRLEDAEREQLLAMLRGGDCKVRRTKRAQLLLMANEGCFQKDIVTALQISKATIQRTCKRYCQEGLESALTERPRPGAVPKLDGRARAQLVALACTDAPEGRTRWTVKLLTQFLIRLEVVDAISEESVRRTLKKGA